MPRLIYVVSQPLCNKQIGDPVEVGDIACSGQETYRVEFFRPPTSPASSGKVTVAGVKDGRTSPGQREFYVGVIGAEWVDRTDRG